MRRTIARYLVVALIQTLRLTCVQVILRMPGILLILKTYLKVKKRFPTLTHMSDVGIITDHERKIIEDIDLKCIQVKILFSLVKIARLVWSQEINRSLPPEK